MKNELIVLEKMELVPFFTKGEQVDDLLSQIEKEALAFVPDVTTAKGRDAIKAMVTKVTKSKTYLESKGKDLAAEYKAIPKVIDENRRIVKEKLTALAAQVREPLTAYEAESLRIATEKMNAEKAAKLAAEVEEAHEFGLLMNEKFDAERLEILKAEREAEAAREAQAKADQEAREKQIAADAAAKAEADKLAAEQRAIEAEQRAKIQAEQAELARIAAEEKAKEDAEKAAEQARVAEIARQASEKAEATAAQAKLEADKKHVGAIRKAAKESIMALGFDEETAKKVVLAIAKGEIANVTISY